MRQMIVKPISANLTRDTELITKMDPYCVVILGTERRRSETKNAAGKNPVWSDILTFANPEDLNSLTLQVFDSDTLTKDDLIGEGNLNISHILSQPGVPFNETVHLTFGTKSAGSLFLILESRAIGQGGFNPLMGHQPL